MTFDSITFILFLAVVLAFHNLPLAWRTRKLFLLVASYLFYAAWNPPLVILLWISTAVDFYAGRKLAIVERARTRRLLVALSVVVNLGLLGFFKYGQFVAENFVSLCGALGLELELAPPSIILPIGISFYTFQSLSYTLDIYRRRSRPARSWLDFALYVTFLPQLVAGPIVRWDQFGPQCEAPRRTSCQTLAWGLFLVTFGLFQKTVLSDALFAPAADRVFLPGTEPGFVESWTGTLAFAGQILCDFSGYSSCAIGTALCLGFRLPLNFRFPYAALGLSDFWRRWHISLSTWLRDYLYIGLGGNRKGPARTLVNLMATMLLGGLWHGASWTFVVWGGLHGLYLIIERIWKSLAPVDLGLRALPRATGWLVTFAAVCLAWVFFRAKSFDDAGRLVAHMLLMSGSESRSVLSLVDVISVCTGMVVLLFAQWRAREKSLQEIIERLPTAGRAALIATMLVLITTASGDDRTFIYFQF